jgi:hypothetical protein
MTDEEWQKFQQGRETLKGDPTAPGGDNKPPWTQGPIDAAKGIAEGAAKGVAGLPGASYIEPKSVSDWAASSDPNHPYSEPVGKVAPLAVGSMFMPDLPFLEAGANAPWLARLASKAAQEGWKGGVTGAAEADPNHRLAGADTGGISAMMAGPAASAVSRVGAPIAAGAAGLAHLGGGHFFGGPWMAYHAMHPLASLAKYLAQQRSVGGPVGAASEWAAKKMGYDTDGDQGQ